MVAGFDHVCGRTDEGTVHCWGANAKGQRGLGDREPREGATQVPLDVPAIRLDAFGRTTCVLDRLHRTVCWGPKGELKPRRGRDLPSYALSLSPMPRMGWPPGEDLRGGCVAVVGGGHQCLIDRRMERGPMPDRRPLRCVVDDGGVQCERGTFRPVRFQAEVPEAVAVATYDRMGCATGPAGGACFDADGRRVRAIPAGDLVAVGAWTVCVAEGLEASCAGSATQDGRLGPPLVEGDPVPFTAVTGLR
jgi:hypothetical protein